jgi:hypothetical protein
MNMPMHRKTILSVSFLLILASAVSGQAPSIQTVSDYNQWGWNAIVMSNGLVTMATMPDIGARVMQYDLAAYPTLFINPDLVGQTHVPARGGLYQYGGFKNWPSPQSKWNWPPPPTLDYGQYACEIAADTPDSVAVFASSPVEQWLSPNIRFERRATLFRGTTRVRMQQTMINEGTASAEWGMWDISQSVVHHAGKSDYGNYWAYFTIDPNSVFGSNGVRWDQSSTAWKGEVAPGVYGVQFLPEGKKIFADSPEGWVAYANRSDSLVSVKTFDLYEGNYPDGGAHVEAWINSGSPYMEVEVVSPVVRLAAAGSGANRYTFTENWWLTRMATPVLGVTPAGAVARRMTYEAAGRRLTGAYGVFYTGTAKAVFFGHDGGILAEGASRPVTPLQPFNLEETLDVPAGTDSVQLRVFDGNGALVGVLDSRTLSQLTGIRERNRTEGTGASSFELGPNFPNPFNGETVIRFDLPAPAEGSLRILSSGGREVAVLENGRLAAGIHRVVWRPGDGASGLYVAVLEAGGIRSARKLLYAK